MLTIGLEKEFFCLDAEGEATVVPAKLSATADSCGWLFEARGKPFPDVVEAVYSLAADEARVRELATQHGLQLCVWPVRKVSREVRLEASRIYRKGISEFSNLYGYDFHKIRYPNATAGIHVSFTNGHPVHDGTGKLVTTVNRIFDFASLFQTLDDVFEAEITAAKRNPGFYELKPDGRIEYRSLPNNIPNDKLIQGIVAALRIAKV